MLEAGRYFISIVWFAFTVLSDSSSLAKRLRNCSFNPSGAEDDRLVQKGLKKQSLNVHAAR
jgi:hypothetical protein